MSDIYRGRDPRELPAYPISEAAYYLRVSPTTLRQWIAGRSYKASDGGRRQQPPVLQIARPSPATLSFNNLVEVSALRALRVREDIPLQRIRPALRWVEKELGVERPLLGVQFLTDGIDLFVDRLGELVNASQGGRIAMRRALEASLRRIERDDEGLAARYFLWADSPDEAQKKIIVDPRVAFGKAVLAGTSVPIAELTDRAHAGESAASMAEDFGLDLSDVETALLWEPRFHAH